MDDKIDGFMICIVGKDTRSSFEKIESLNLMRISLPMVSLFLFMLYVSWVSLRSPGEYSLNSIFSEQLRRKEKPSRWKKVRLEGQLQY